MRESCAPGSKGGLVSQNPEGCQALAVKEALFVIGVLIFRHCRRAQSHGL